MPHVDIWRAAAAFSVVIIHTTPFLKNLNPAGIWYYIGQIIQQCTSFAVPLFFIAAGYFYSLGIRSHGFKSQFVRYERRIFKLIIIWFIIDGIFWANWLKPILDNVSLKPLLWNISAVPSFALKRPDLFFLRGTAVPLWFLVSLIAGIFFLSVFIRMGLKKYTILIFGFGAYLFNLCSSSYSNTLIGLGHNIPLEQRGITISFFFLAIGYCLASTKITVKGTTILAISVFAMFIEGMILSINDGVPFIEHPYLFSTVTMASGVFILAIQNPMIGNESIMAKIGLISLGIYLVHTPVLGALNYFRNLYQNPFYELIFPFCVFFLSVLIVFAIKKTPYLRTIIA